MPTPRCLVHRPALESADCSGTASPDEDKIIPDFPRHVLGEILEQEAWQWHLAALVALEQAPNVSTP